MVRFELLEPGSLPEACALLAEHQGQARIVAGGQGLLPMLKHRAIVPRYLVDIKRLPDLEYVRSSEDGLCIGALATHRVIETSPLVHESHPALAALEKRVGCMQSRNWGTVAGNICQATPTSDLAPALLALGASLKIASLRGMRELSMDDFFVGYQKTALATDEILAEIAIPPLTPHSAAVYRKEAVRATDCPIASVAVALGLDAERRTIATARIVLQAVGVTPLRALEAEQRLIGEAPEDALVKEVAWLAGKAARPISDVYGSATLKRHTVKVITEDLIQEAVRQARAA